MPPAPKRYYALLPEPTVGDPTGDYHHSVMDMLRYDRCAVEERVKGHWLLSADHPFTLGRWESFGIKLIGGGWIDTSQSELKAQLH